MPSALSSAAEPWTHEKLAEIVNDTIDLAKVRAVDIDALRSNQDTGASGDADVGAFLPAINFAADPTKAGWARDSLLSAFDKLGQTLTDAPDCVDFFGFTSGNGLGSMFDASGMELLNLYGESQAIKFVNYFTVFFWVAPKGIRMTWDPGARGELMITISRFGSVDPHSVRMIPSVHAYNASDDIVSSGWAEQFENRFRFRVDLDRAVRIDIGRNLILTSEDELSSYSVDSICLRANYPLPLPANEIRVGTEIEGYVVHGITLRGAPAGKYTFRQLYWHVGEVSLRRNGIEVLKLEFDRNALISADDSCCFSFPGYFDIDIGMQGSGTRTLTGLKYSFFDGNQFLQV